VFAMSTGTQPARVVSGTSVVTSGDLVTTGRVVTTGEDNYTIVDFVEGKGSQGAQTGTMMSTSTPRFSGGNGDEALQDLDKLLDDGSTTSSDSSNTNSRKSSRANSNK